MLNSFHFRLCHTLFWHFAGICATFSASLSLNLHINAWLTVSPGFAVFVWLYDRCFGRRRVTGCSHGGVWSSPGGRGGALPAWAGLRLPAWQWGSVKCRSLRCVKQNVEKLSLMLTEMLLQCCEDILLFLMFQLKKTVYPYSMQHFSL